MTSRTLLVTRFSENVDVSAVSYRQDSGGYWSIRRLTPLHLKTNHDDTMGSISRTPWAFLKSKKKNIYPSLKTPCIVVVSKRRTPLDNLIFKKYSKSQLIWLFRDIIWTKWLELCHFHGISPTLGVISWKYSKTQLAVNSTSQTPWCISWFKNPAKLKPVRGMINIILPGFWRLSLLVVDLISRNRKGGLIIKKSSKLSAFSVPLMIASRDSLYIKSAEC